MENTSTFEIKVKKRQRSPCAFQGQWTKPVLRNCGPWASFILILALAKDEWSLHAQTALSLGKAAPVLNRQQRGWPQGQTGSGEENTWNRTLIVQPVELLSEIYMSKLKGIKPEVLFFLVLLLGACYRLVLKFQRCHQMAFMSAAADSNHKSTSVMLLLNTSIVPLVITRNYNLDRFAPLKSITWAIQSLIFLIFIHWNYHNFKLIMTEVRHRNGEHITECVMWLCVSTLIRFSKTVANFNKPHTTPQEARFPFFQILTSTVVVQPIKAETTLALINLHCQCSHNVGTYATFFGLF